MLKCTKKVAMAIACHPDDIEFMMAGTLIRLRDAGYEVHYMNIANGSLGTNSMSYEEIVCMRREEAMNAAKIMGAVYHESICDDLEVLYTPQLLAKVVEVFRQVEPSILLTHGPYDYMEDHINAGRLAVSAAFCRGMTNFKCDRSIPATLQDVAVYHSQPHSLTDSLRRVVKPDFFVDITSTMEEKKAMLSCHKSQKEWLDKSQGNDAYIDELIYRGKHYGKMSGKYEYADGWIRHSYLGFGPEDFDPLAELQAD
ncbi:MAG: PIG-L deacetylase family protein [Lentisphaeria bacterium]